MFGGSTEGLGYVYTYGSVVGNDNLTRLWGVLQTLLYPLAGQLGWHRMFANILASVGRAHAEEGLGFHP